MDEAQDKNRFVPCLLELSQLLHEHLTSKRYDVSQTMPITIKEICLLIARFTYFPNEAYFTNHISLLDKYCAKYYPSLNIFHGIFELIVCQFVGGVQWNNNFIDEIEQYDNFKQKQFHFESVQPSIQLATFHTPVDKYNYKQHSSNIGLDTDLEDTKSKKDDIELDVDMIKKSQGTNDIKNDNRNRRHNNDNNSKKKNMRNDKKRIGTFARKIEEYVGKYPFISDTDAMYYIIYDECNQMSDIEQKKFINQHERKMKQENKPSESNDSQFGKYLSCVISPINGYEWRLHKKGLMSRLKYQLKAIKRKNKTKMKKQSNININDSHDHNDDVNNISDDDSSDGANEDDRLLSADVDINDYDINFNIGLTLSNNLTNDDISYLEKIAESKMYEINCKWIQLDWFYNQYLKNQLIFNKNFSLVQYNDHHMYNNHENNKFKFQSINLKSYLPIFNDQEIMINCYILGRRKLTFGHKNNLWIGIMNKVDCQQQGNIQIGKDCIVYAARDNSPWQCGGIYTRDRVHGGLESYERYDCISFYINTSEIVSKQCCKIFKNDQMIYESKILPYKTFDNRDPFDRSQIYFVGVVDEPGRAIIVEQAMLSQTKKIENVS